MSAALLVVALLTGVGPFPVVRLGTVEAPARPVLEAAWSDEPTAAERGYCAVLWLGATNRYKLGDRLVSDSIVRVLAVAPAETHDAAPDGGSFRCAPGVPLIHSHPAASCYATGCVKGGPGAYQCQPSRVDYETLLREKQPFGVIQCTREGFRFYYPADYAGQPGGAA